MYVMVGENAYEEPIENGLNGGADTPLDTQVKSKMEQCLKPETPELKVALEKLNSVETQQALYDWIHTLPEGVQVQALQTFFAHYPEYKLTVSQREKRETLGENRTVTKEEVYGFADESLRAAKEQGVDEHMTDLFKADYELNKVGITAALVREFETTAYTNTILPGLKSFLATSTYKDKEKAAIEKNFHDLVIQSFRSSFSDGPSHQFAFLKAKMTWDAIEGATKGKTPAERLAIVGAHSRGMAIPHGMPGGTEEKEPEKPVSPTVSTDVIKTLCAVGTITPEQLGLKDQEAYAQLCKKLDHPATQKMHQEMGEAFSGIFAAQHLNTTTGVLRKYEEYKIGTGKNPDAIVLPSEKAFVGNIPKTYTTAVAGITLGEYGRWRTKAALQETAGTLKGRANSIKDFVTDLIGPEGLKILQEEGLAALILHFFDSDAPDVDKQKVQEMLLDPSAVALGKEYAENKDAKPLAKLDERGAAILGQLTKDDLVVVRPLSSFNGFVWNADKKMLIKEAKPDAPGTGDLLYLTKNGQEVVVAADKRKDVKERPQDMVDLSQKSEQLTFLLSHIRMDIVQQQLEAKFGTDRSLNMPADFRKDKPYTQQELNDPLTGLQKKQELMGDFVAYELKKLMTKDHTSVIDGTGSLIALLTHDVAVGEHAVNTAVTSLPITLYDKEKGTFGTLPQGAEYLKADGTWAPATATEVLSGINGATGKVEMRLATAPRYIQTYEKEKKV